MFRFEPAFQVEARRVSKLSGWSGGPPGITKFECRGRICEEPDGDQGIADCASSGRVRQKRHDRVAIEVVHYVPRRVQEPAEPDEAIRAEPPVGDKGEQGGEGEFPPAQSAAAKISRAGAADHDGHQVSSARFLQKRGSGYEKDRDDNGSDAIH